MEPTTTFLEPDEIQRITEYKSIAAQCRELTRLNIPWKPTRTGKPLVLREVLRESFGAKSTPRKALAAGVLKDRFRIHDIRAKRASDGDPAHAQDLLGHSNPTTTRRHFLRRPKVIKTGF